MGWWETEDGLTLGDGPLDELHRSVRDVAATYRNAVERPPTVAELQAVLALVLGSLGPDEVSGLDELAISAVTLKTKKAPAKRKYATGDVFAVPLDDGTFGFGRIVHADTYKGEVYVEFFPYRSATPLAAPDVVDLGRLGNVEKLWAGSSFVNGRWPVLHHTPGYVAPDHDEIRFQFWQGGDRYTLLPIAGLAIGRDLPRSEVPEDLPYSDAYDLDPDMTRPSKLETEVTRRLDEAGL